MIPESRREQGLMMDWSVSRNATLLVLDKLLNRIGLIDTDDAVKAEEQLTEKLPPDRWTLASDTLILHGRRICKPKPQCDRCVITADCRYFLRLGPKAARKPARRA